MNVILIILVFPHISTSWEYIAALCMQEGDLVIHLMDGDVIAVSNLTEEETALIFRAHAAYLERESSFRSFRKKGFKSLTERIAGGFIRRGAHPLWLRRL